MMKILFEFEVDSTAFDLMLPLLNSPVLDKLKSITYVCPACNQSITTINGEAMQYVDRDDEFERFHGELKCQIPQTTVN